MLTSLVELFNSVMNEDRNNTPNGGMLRTRPTAIENTFSDHIFDFRTRSEPNRLPITPLEDKVSHTPFFVEHVLGL